MNKIYQWRSKKSEGGNVGVWIENKANKKLASQVVSTVTRFMILSLMFLRGIRGLFNNNNMREEKAIQGDFENTEFGSDGAFQFMPLHLSRRMWSCCPGCTSRRGRWINIIFVIYFIKYGRNGTWKQWRSPKGSGTHTVPKSSPAIYIKSIWSASAGAFSAYN